MPPRFFATADDMRAWFRQHHASVDELWVGYYKVATGRASVTWAESVDVALCFGWIDGLRRSLGETSYQIRFTPRRPRSGWSARNLARMDALLADGLVEEAGLRAFEARRPAAPAPAVPSELPQAYAAKLEADAEARRFFRSMRASDRRAACRWVLAAKRECTRLRRLETLVSSCAKRKPIPPLRWNAAEARQAD